VLQTGSLLTRLQALRSLGESYQESDWRSKDYDIAVAANLVTFKDTQQWKLAYSDVKVVFTKR